MHHEMIKQLSMLIDKIISFQRFQKKLTPFLNKPYHFYVTKVLCFT